MDELELEAASRPPRPIDMHRCRTRRAVRNTLRMQQDVEACSCKMLELVGGIEPESLLSTFF